MPNTSSIALEQKIAQLFMLGYEGKTPSDILGKFLKAGLGGIIFFRDNFQHMQQSLEVADLLANFKKQANDSAPELFLSLDQEGGQVERLPHTVFPSLITPLAIASAKNPEALAKTTYTLMANHLAALGFNFNYAPTLDVNLEAKNPIIGVRAFGSQPDTVWKLAKIAKDCFWDASIIPVGKHFPGHGNGTVDSHLKLPHLQFTETELIPFQSAINDGIPVMLVSHGFYPALQTSPEEYETPASASKTIIQKLLKETCKFEGLIISDDMCMGAITQGKDPVEAAIQSIEAGIDMLVYKQSTDAEWQVYMGLIDAVKSGRLSEQRIDEAYDKIVSLKKARLSPASQTPPVSDWAADYLQSQSLPIAQASVNVLSGNKELLPFKQNGRYILLHPDRSTITNYRFDQPTSQELPEMLSSIGFSTIDAYAYPVEISGRHDPAAVIPAIDTTLTPDAILFVTFNPLIQPIQQTLYKLLKTHYPSVPLIIISAGTAYDGICFEDITLHLTLCSYRPPSMQALAGFLSSTSPVEKLATQTNDAAVFSG